MQPRVYIMRRQGKLEIRVQGAKGGPGMRMRQKTVSQRPGTITTEP